MKIIVKILCYLLSVLIFLAGLFIFMYPLINRNLINNNAQQNLESFRFTREVYKKTKDEPDNNENLGNSYIESRKLDELYKDMKKYNDRIYEEGQKNLKDAWSYEQSSFDLYSYGIYNGIIGEIKIPAMECDLPLYMGATMSNMAKGAAQLGETSTPVGGNNTNCVIAGHRGASGGKFFLDIQNLKIGDKVYIDNLWESLVYEVSEIEIIDPSDINRIFIKEGKDMVTLITCHPYPYNYQRYVVYCERTEKPFDNKDDKSESGEVSQIAQPNTAQMNKSSVSFMTFEKIVYIGTPIILVLLFLILTFVGRKKKNKNK